MTQQTKTTVKSYFEAGDKPTAGQFTDLIDSCAFLAETSSQTFRANIVVSGKLTNPCVPKAWALVQNDAGTPELKAGFNVSALTDTGQGAVTIKLKTPLATVSAGFQVNCNDKLATATVSAVTVSAFRVDTTMFANASATDTGFFVTVYTL